MKILGVTHPIPTEYAKRIYDDNKTVYVGKSNFIRVLPGQKFIIYESYGAKAYTGWADIKFIGNMEKEEILKKYEDLLFISKDEFKKYTTKRREMNVIEFENFEKFAKPVIPKRYVSPSGKYIYKEEYEKIIKSKD